MSKAHDPLKRFEMNVNVNRAFLKVRTVILLTTLCVIFSLQIEAQAIDRFGLVNRHNIVLKEIDPLAPLSVGNGDFA